MLRSEHQKEQRYEMTDTILDADPELQPERALRALTNTVSLLVDVVAATVGADQHRNLSKQELANAVYAMRDYVAVAEHSLAGVPGVPHKINRVAIRDLIDPDEETYGVDPELWFMWRNGLHDQAIERFGRQAVEACRLARHFDGYDKALEDVRQRAC